MASAPDAGIAASLRRLLDGLLQMAQLRLELLSTEIESEKLRIFDALVWLVLALMCATTGLLLAVAFVVMLMPDSARATALGVLAGLFVAAALALALHARRRLESPGGALRETVDELRRDRATLGGGD